MFVFREENKHLPAGFLDSWESLTGKPKSARGLQCEPAELFLFGPHSLNQPLTILDPRIVEISTNADDRNKRRILRVVRELV